MNILKKILFLAILSFLSMQADCQQVTVWPIRPDQSPIQLTPTDANTEFYTMKGGTSLKRVPLGILQKSIAPKAQPSPQLSYIPTATGNPVADRGKFVKGSNGNTYYIDWDGRGIICSSAGSSFTAGAGISILGSTISNTGDLSSTNEIQTLSQPSFGTLKLTKGTAASNFVTLPDSSATNEFQNLSISGNQLSISNGTGVTLPAGTVYSAGTGIDISGSTISNSGDLSDSNELQNLSINGQSLSISGGNSVTLPSAANFTAGSGISISANTISTVFDGSYDNLTNKPPAPLPQVQSDWNATTGLGVVLNKPTIPSAQVQSDWNATTGLGVVLNKPTIPSAQVQSDWNATTGLGVVLNKPTIPAAQVQSDWNATTGLGVVLNKPTIPTLVNADWNATSGTAQILNKPAIPAAQVQSDWNATTGLGVVLNKPTLFSGNYASLSGIPTSFTPSAHTHILADVTGLQAALNAKQDVLTGTESVFNGWDKDASNDFSGNYNDLTNKPLIGLPNIYAYNLSNNVTAFIDIANSSAQNQIEYEFPTANYTVSYQEITGGGANNSNRQRFTITPLNPLPTTAVTNQVLAWNGTAWVAQNSASGADNWGSQTVQASSSFSGNGTAATPLALANSGVTFGTYNNVTVTNKGIVTGGSNVPYLQTEVDGSVTNEIQALSIVGNNLTLSNGGGTVALPTGTTYTAGTGININSNVISTAFNGTFNGLTGIPATFPPSTHSHSILEVTGLQTALNAKQDAITAGTGLLLTGNTLSNSGDLSNTNELQTISKTGSTVTLSNSGGSFTDADTDAQTLSVSGGNLSISGGNTVALPTGTTYTAGQGIGISGTVITNLGDTDNNPNNELQSLSLSGSNLTLSGGGGTITLPGGAPTGAAGGDLSGNYPNPSIATWAVTGNKIAAGAIENHHIADGTIQSVDLANVGVSAAIYSNPSSITVNAKGQVTNVVAGSASGGNKLQYSYYQTFGNVNFGTIGTIGTFILEVTPNKIYTVISNCAFCTITNLPPSGVLVTGGGQSTVTIVNTSTGLQTGRYASFVIKEN